MTPGRCVGPGGFFVEVTFLGAFHGCHVFSRWLLGMLFIGFSWVFVFLVVAVWFSSGLHWSFGVPCSNEIDGFAIEYKTTAMSRAFFPVSGEFFVSCLFEDLFRR